VSDDKVIDFVKVLEERKMNEVKKELEATIYDLDIDIEKILSSFVIFNDGEYNNITDIDEKQMIINNLLDTLGLHEAAEDIQNVINKLNKNSYGDSDEN
jgi:hypothetical protein